MLFQTPQFFLFLGVVLILFYSAPQAWRKFILLVASYYFYMSWIPVFILLLLSLTAIDYAAARWIARVSSPAQRKAALVVSLSANLGLLGFFKYHNFFAENIALLLHRPPDSFAISIILPLGISFHTFQSMSYVIDVYRGEQEPIVNPIDYALFISFFPQLVAGPIVRAREFFGDLYQWRKPTPQQAAHGLLLLVLWDLPRRPSWPTSSRRSRTAISGTRPGIRACCRPGPAPSPSASRFTSIFRAIPTCPSGWRSCSGSTSRSTSGARTWHPASPTSGIAGTFRCRGGCGIICTFRWAAIGAER